MLTFGDQVEILDDCRCACMVCQRRRASWMAQQRREIPREGGGKPWMQSMCGWCVLYSPFSAWGYANREELLHVGRASQEMALKTHRKEIPQIDDRGRLGPEDADKFLLGVAFTDKMLQRLGVSP